MVDLAPPGATSSYIVGISADGNSLFGTFETSNRNSNIRPLHAFITDADGRQFRDLTPAGAESSELFWVTADGTNN